MFARTLGLAAGDGGEFVPHAPKSTAEAEQRGWYNSQSGDDYTIFYWPKYQVYTVHDANLEPVNNYVTKSEREAIAYIQKELDKGYVEPMKKLDPTWAFSNAIEASKGVDQWLGDGAVLEHNGDWIRLYWRVQDQGAGFYVAYEFEKGNVANMPQDFEFVLMPGERKTVYNTESAAAYYNVRVKYTGAVELPAADDEYVEPVAISPARAYVFNGPIMTRLRGLLGR